MDEVTEKPIQPRISDQKIALLYGLRTGAVVALANVVIGFLPIGSYGLLLVILILCGAGYWTGSQVARRVGRARIALLSGLFAGLCCVFIFLLQSLVIALVFNRPAIDATINALAIEEKLPVEVARTEYFKLFAFLLVAYSMFQVGITTLFAGLGGLAGKRQYTPPDIEEEYADEEPYSEEENAVEEVSKKDVPEKEEEPKSPEK